MRPILSYVLPGWFPFLCDTLQKDLEVYHKSVCGVIHSIWLSRLHSRPTATQGVVFPPAKKHVESPLTIFLQTGLLPPGR